MYNLLHYLLLQSTNIHARFRPKPKKAIMLSETSKLLDTLYVCLFNFVAFLRTYILGARYLCKEVYNRKLGKNKPFSLEDLPVSTGQVAVVTGGTEGIGLQTVYQLLSKGMHVIVGAKLSSEECLKLKMSLEKHYPEGKIDVWPVELSSMTSVRKFADRFLKEDWPLHVLVNNAGVMYVPYSITEDGFEEHMAVNYFSHCLLTKLLIPQLASTGNASRHSRIVMVSSATHFSAYIDFDNVHGQRHYSKYHAYIQSKLALVLMTYKLQRYVQSNGYRITANCLHPGIANTSLYKHVWWAELVAPYFFKSPLESAKTLLHCCLSPELEGIGGKYLEECCVVPSSRLSYDKQIQSRLWSVTWQLLDKWI